MLEIAGGIVLGFLALGVAYLALVALVGLVSHFSEWIVVGIGILLAVGLFYIGCWAAWNGWEWFRGIVGDYAAHMVADPVCVFIGGFAPFLIWIDSLQDFKRTARFFRWIVRVGKPSTWREWGQRHKLAARP